MRIFWPVTLAAAALVGLLAYGVVAKHSDRRSTTPSRTGSVPPHRSVRCRGCSSPETGSLADYKGKVVVLNVWASWCDPCREEVPLLQKTHEQIAPKGGVVLGLDTQDASRQGDRLPGERKATFPSLRDRDRTYGREFGVTGYPETFLIDRKGRIAALRRLPVTQAVARSAPAEAAGGEGMRLAGRHPAAGVRGARRARRTRRSASLPDIEDEVMCVECGTVLSRLQLAGGAAGARVHPRADRRRQGQGADQGRARGASTARRCSPSPRPTASTPPLWIVPIVLVAAGRGRDRRRDPALAGQRRRGPDRDRPAAGAERRGCPRLDAELSR